MIDDRISLMIAGKNEHQPYFFPFTLAGICSQISLSEASELNAINYHLEGDIYLRVACEENSSLLYDLLRSYGTSSCNYENLEFFAEEKLDLIVRNMTHCLNHRYFITFLLVCEKRPIAFFQVDPYCIQVIENTYQNKLLLRWNHFFDEPIDLFDLATRNVDDCQNWLLSHVKADVFNDFVKSRNLPWNAIDGVKFVAYSVQTYKCLREKLVQNRWIGNISYNVLPEFQRKGLMAKMTLKIEGILAKHTECCGLFSDRIACKNKRSIALLEKFNFNKSGTFSCYYGEAYHTRAYPKGNFAESCVCFYKKII